MLIQVNGHDSADFVGGLEVAQRLAEEMPNRTPALLRSAASSLEACATSMLELGVACGLRIVAGEVEDAIEDAIAHHPSSTQDAEVRTLQPVGRAT